MKVWKAEYSDGVTPIRNPDATWQFNFPEAPGHINYFMRNFPEGIIPKSIVVKFEIKPDCTFISLDPNKGDPPNVRIMLRRDMNTDDGRWWPDDPWYTRLTGGIFTSIISMESGTWKNVQGKTSKERPAQFRAFLPDINSVGLTFGGGSSYGHGIQIPQGKRCTFHLLSYKVT